MGFRNELEAARARIAQLEEENRQLRAEVERLSGGEPLEEPPPPAPPVGRPIWWPGESFVMGGASSAQGLLLAYTGECEGSYYLRVLNVGHGVLADHVLADKGAEQTARIANGIVVPLQDRSLGWITWPGHEVTRRLRLPAPLVAQPVARDGMIMTVTAERELLRIEPDEWRVVERRAVSGGELEKLGIPDPQSRGAHNGYKAPSSVKALARDGWSVAAVRTMGDVVLCAFNREFAGNEQVAAAVVERRSGRPLWFREAGPGHFMYLYAVDGVLLLHNVSLEVEAYTWGLRGDSGRLLLRTVGRGEAQLEIYDDDEKVQQRSAL